MKYYIFLFSFFSISVLSAQIPISEKDVLQPVDSLTLYWASKAEIKYFKNYLEEKDSATLLVSVYRTEDNQYVIFCFDEKDYRKVYRYGFDIEKKLIAKVLSSMEDAIKVRETSIKLNR